MSNPIVIFGSSRSTGNTWNAIQMVLQDSQFPIVDLNKFDFSTFDYEQKNRTDDFKFLTEQMLAHDAIILATPIYWYSMSAVMKKFIDRWSDFLTSDKETGRKMRGKTLYIITSYYTHPNGKEGFEDVFEKICKYMGMNYGGCFFYYSGENKELIAQNEDMAQKFRAKL